ncbi:MAG TPA: LysE family transporter, partial [Dehalococcoidia bacterium]|nr:LysE family transporter [Dehalococcoidia bacterium]
MSAAALAAIFGSSLLVSLTGALSPGPLTTVAVREGVRRGFWAGPALAAGHGLIELALVVALALGLNQLLDHDAVAAAVAIVGGGFLLWLGFQVLRQAPRQELHIEAAGVSDGPATHSALSRRAAPAFLAPGGYPGLAAAGIALSVSNPFW